MVRQTEKTVKFMKKLWNVFWITETLILTGTSAAAVSLCRANGLLGAAAVVSGLLAAAAYRLHFRSLGYELEGDRIIVHKGIVVRSRREIPVESVLMSREITLLGRTLYTALTTAGGTVTLYCRLTLEHISTDIA